MTAALRDLVERLEAFEISDEIGNGDFSLLREAAAELRRIMDEPVYKIAADQDGVICIDIGKGESIRGKRVRILPAGGES